MLSCAHDSLLNKWVLLQNSEELQLPCLSKATQNSIFGFIQSELRNSKRDSSNQKCFLLSTKKVEFMMKAARSSLTPKRNLMIPQVPRLAVSTADPCKFLSSIFNFGFLRAIKNHRDFRITYSSTHRQEYFLTTHSDNNRDHHLFAYVSH